MPTAAEKPASRFSSQPLPALQTLFVKVEVGVGMGGCGYGVVVGMRVINGIYAGAWGRTPTVGVGMGAINGVYAGAWGGSGKSK